MTRDCSQTVLGPRPASPEEDLTGLHAEWTPLEWGMDVYETNRRRGFWPLALLWLPAGLAATAAVRFTPETGTWTPTLLMWVGYLFPVAPSGLPLAFACRRLWRLGYRRSAWTAGVALGAVTVAAALVAGLLGPVAIAVCAVILSLPVWLVWWWLNRRDRC